VTSVTNVKRFSRQLGHSLVFCFLHTVFYAEQSRLLAGSICSDETSLSEFRAHQDEALGRER